jgi:hypothetical protein
MRLYAEAHEPASRAPAAGALPQVVEAQQILRGIAVAIGAVADLIQCVDQRLIAGALWAFIYTSSVEALAFQIDRSFQILFMIIIGGLGSVLGSFLGAAFIVLLPIFLSNAPALFGLHMQVDLITHLEFMIFGGLIIFFLIVEPHGLARLWQVGKEKLRRWPFPY